MSDYPRYTPKCGHQFCGPVICRFADPSEPLAASRVLNERGDPAFLIAPRELCLGEPIDLAEEQIAGPRCLVNAFLISIVIAAVLVAAFVLVFR